MWLYLIALAMVGLGVVLALVGGGIFTIVLIPLGLIALVAAAVAGTGGRKAQQRGGGGGDASQVSDRPLPTHSPRPSGREQTSPEALADARRAQQ